MSSSLFSSGEHKLNKANVIFEPSLLAVII